MNLPEEGSNSNKSGRRLPRLLCFDFDGTMVCNQTEDPVHPNLMEELDHWRAAGARWIINTGRREEELRDGLTQRGVDRRPDFVVVEETGLFELLGESEWRPVGDWNERRDEALRALKRRAHRALREIRRFLESSTQAAYLEGDPVDEILARTEREMDEIAVVIDQIRSNQGVPELGYQRNTIYLRFGHTDFQKGSTLRELTRHLELDPSQVLAAGDNHNDLSMLHRSVAHHLICPSNALPLVRETTKEHGGTVTTKPHGKGLADGLRRIRLRRS